MLTVAEAKTSRLKRIAGLCPDSQDFIDILNDATSELMTRGDFWATMKRMRGCIYNGCITWPRAVGTVKAFDRCGSAPPKNHWFGFDAVLPGDFEHWRNTGSFLCARDMALVDHGTSPVFNQIPCGTNRYVRYYITDPADVGKTITVFGIDGFGNEVITERADGTVQPGVVLTLAIPYVQSPMLFRRIDRVIKQPTVRPVYGYQFDGNLWPLSVYQPSETLPDYRTERLVWSHCPTTNCQQWPSQISALVKLQFIPVENDDDQVLIGNVNALFYAMQSIKLGDAFDVAGGGSLMARAVRELNNELREKLPDDQIPVRFKPWGTATLERQGIGRMM